MKKLLIMLIALLPVMGYAAEVCDVSKDTQTGNKRSLVCDDELPTTTTFKTTKEEQVLKNDVCTITCTEEIVFMIEPIQKVLAGTSFSYPLYASGERKCKATYNYAAYETKIKTLVNEYKTLTGTQKQTKKNEIDNYYAQRQACDEFTKKDSKYEQKYEYDSYDIDMKIETSTNEVNVDYVFKELAEYGSTVTEEEVSYNACNYNDSKVSCDYNDTTISGWSETARIYGKYTMKDTYIENYTGEVKNVYSDTTCNVGDRFFTDLKELTRPTANDKDDKGYRLTLTAKKLGDNLGTTIGNWELDVTCWYQVKNLMFPQNNPGGNKDENYDEYGGTAFQYRLIDLDNPFPGREAGANWKGKESIITSTKDNLSTMQRFVITLNRSEINKIRDYNGTHSYDTFNLDEMEKSQFIIDNEHIIDRK